MPHVMIALRYLFVRARIIQVAMTGALGPLLSIPDAHPTDPTHFNHTLPRWAHAAISAVHPGGAVAFSHSSEGIL